MTSVKQIEANRRNSLKSTDPKTQTGKQASRCNAVRHGLTAETVIGALEDAEDYKAFEAAITADSHAQSAVERELVLRLASLLWRLRRATTIETGLFEIQADHLSDFRKTRLVSQASREIVYALFNASSHRQATSVGLRTTSRAGPRRLSTFFNSEAVNRVSSPPYSRIAGVTGELPCCSVCELQLSSA